MAFVAWRVILAVGGVIHPRGPGERLDSAIFLFIWGTGLWLLWTRSRWVVGLAWKGMNAPMDLTVTSMGRAMETRVARETSEEIRVLHHGAVEVDPRHLVYWVCVQTDAEKIRLQSDPILARDLRQILNEYQYPRKGREAVQIGIESQETVDRVSQGDWWRHMK